jgi:multidrug efflux pump subunit AcrB
MMRFFALRYRLRWPLYIGVTFLIGIPLFLIEEPERASGGEEPQPAVWEQAASYYFENREAIDPWIGGLSYRFATQASFNPPWGRSFGETITVSVSPPQGSPLEEIDKIIRNFETLGDTYSEALLYYETDVSEYSGARLRFHIDPDYLFDPLPYMLYGEAAYLAARTGNVRTSVRGMGDAFSSGYGGSSASFQVRFRGYSYDDLYTTARDLERRLNKSRRVDNVDINKVGWGRSDYQQYQLRLDEARLFAKGLNRRALLETIQMDLNPTNTFGQVEFQGQNMFLIGINQPAGIYLEDFTQAPRSFGETGFTIDEVAEIVREPAMGQIRREDQSYIRTVSFDFLGPQRLGRRYLDTVLETLPLPVGTQIEDQRGFSFQREEDRQATWMMLALALLSVWMIVSALLERWRDPLIVIMAVPLSLIGIMAGVLYTGIVFDQGAIAGSLLAVGVVVNNGILLMHERERLNLAGVQGLRSWVKVYRRKMRPVLITTLTTIGGLLPLIFLGSSDFWSDLATVVVWGLSFSTIGILALAGVWEGSFEF